MDNNDTLETTISTLLTKLTLKKQRDRNSRELIQKMKDIVLSVRDEYDAFIKQCEDVIAHFSCVEKHRKSVEDKIKKELAELHQFSNLKQKVYDDLVSIMDFN